MLFSNKPALCVTRGKGPCGKDGHARWRPPSEESLEVVSKRYLKHQKARLTPAAYERERGVLEAHPWPFFGDKTRLCSYPAGRRAKVHHASKRRSLPRSITKELNVLKHLLGLATEWELISVNPAHGVKSPKVPPGRVRYLQPTELRTVLKACLSGCGR